MHDHDDLERLEEAEVESRIGPVRSAKRKRAAARDAAAGPSDAVTGTTTRASKGRKKRAAVAPLDQSGTIGAISAVTVPVGGEGVEGEQLAMFGDAGVLVGAGLDGSGIGSNHGHGQLVAESSVRNDAEGFSIS